MKILAKFDHFTNGYVAYNWIRGEVKHKLYIPRSDFRFPATTPTEITLYKNGQYIEHPSENVALALENKRLKQKIEEYEERFDSVRMSISTLLPSR